MLKNDLLITCCIVCKQRDVDCNECYHGQHAFECPSYRQHDNHKRKPPKEYRKSNKS